MSEKLQLHPARDAMQMAELCKILHCHLRIKLYHIGITRGPCARFVIPAKHFFCRSIARMLTLNFVHPSANASLCVPVNIEIYIVCRTPRVRIVYALCTHVVVIIIIMREERTRGLRIACSCAREHARGHYAPRACHARIA